MDQLENYIKQADAADSLSKQAAAKGDKVEELAKKDEALQWYGKAAAIIIPPQPSSLEIKDPYEKQREFQEKGARKIVLETMKLKNQKKYDEAIKVYKYAQDRFKTEIAQLEALQRPQQQIEEAKKDWIFITEMPREKEQETAYWRIIKDPITQKHILEINKNEKDFITHETFTEMMQKAQQEHIPFFLVMLEVRTAKKTLSFYEGKNVIHFLMSLEGNIIDPKTQAGVLNIAIFVMGDDSKFTKLREDVNPHSELSLPWEDFLNKFFVQEFRKLKDILSEKGKSQLLVADLFKNEAQKESNQKQKQELLQHARQWYEWALKYLPAGSPEYTQAQEQIKKIPKVEILPEKPQEPKKPQEPVQDQKILIQNLQNLTKKLQQIPATLV